MININNIKNFQESKIYKIGIPFARFYFNFLEIFSYQINPFHNMFLDCGKMSIEYFDFFKKYYRILNSRCIYVKQFNFIK